MDILFEKAIKEGTYIITLNFIDEDNEDDLPPTTVLWTLQDPSGQVINNREDETETPAAEVNIVLSGDDLAITGQAAERILIVHGTYNSSYGNNLPYRKGFQFEIEDM